MAGNNPLLTNRDNTEENSGNDADGATSGATNNQAAIELLRSKITRIYGEEPDAEQELAEADSAPPRELSKHQKFMLKLQSSGKSFAHIQTDWHNYYVALPDEEKLEVWREFYAKQSKITRSQSAAVFPRENKPAPESDKINPKAADHYNPATPLVGPRQTPRTRRVPKPRRLTAKNPSEIKSRIKTKTSARAHFESNSQNLKQHLQSLAFGLGIGVVVVLIFMFGFFNQKFIVPFIHPGRASATPIILDPTAVSPTKQPEIIIPKINVEIPLVFDVNSTRENDVETALEDGVIHYPTTVLPGEQGNTAFFGHSSNNIFSPGKYKFAFVLLEKLKNNDIFYITYDRKIYVYKVYDKQVVSPSNVSVLNDVPGKKATATLITCDPPGTSLNRLVVWGKQISPAPHKNNRSNPAAESKPNRIVGNGPSLWSRIWPF